MNIRYIFPLLLGGALLFSCSKEKRDILIPYPEDITFEDYALERFSFEIPDAPFQSGDKESGVITFNVKKHNDGTFSGFAVSNKNWRSYPWNLSPDFGPTSLTPEQIKSSVDSCIFSVYTERPNHTLNYLVANTDGGEAYITLQKPTVVEHILVANTTYNYLLTKYGSTYSGTLDDATQAYLMTGTKVQNPTIPNPSTTMYGRFYLPGPDGQDVVRLEGADILAERAGEESVNGYVKLIVTGSEDGVSTGTVEFYLAARPGADPAHPEWDDVAPDWFKVDLTSLGTVDKLSFDLASSYADDDGRMLYPRYFCLDGIRLRR